MLTHLNSYHKDIVTRTCKQSLHVRVHNYLLVIRCVPVLEDFVCNDHGRGISDCDKDLPFWPSKADANNLLETDLGLLYYGS